MFPTRLFYFSPKDFFSTSWVTQVPRFLLPAAPKQREAISDNNTAILGALCEDHREDQASGLINSEVICRCQGAGEGCRPPHSRIWLSYVSARPDGEEDRESE